MGNKYLPIGSIVNVNGIQKKIMIIGYYSLEYNNSVKMFDYVGIGFPEGMLLKNTYSFNHDDITSIDFMGYPNDDYKKLNAILIDQQSVSVDSNLQSQNNFVNLKFDENGVVIYDEVSNVKKAPEILPRSAVKNPFGVKEQAQATGKKPVFAFDENGVVTGETMVEETEEVKEEKAKIESNFKFGFDANGIVTEEIDLDNEEIELPKPKYKFDANGFIIGEGEEVTSIDNSSEIQKPVYKFDENGVITEEIDSSEEATPEYHFDENGITVNA